MQVVFSGWRTKRGIVDLWTYPLFVLIQSGKLTCSVLLYNNLICPSSNNCLFAKNKTPCAGGTENGIDQLNSPGQATKDTLGVMK